MNNTNNPNNKKNILKWIDFSCLANIASWIIFSLCDFIDELLDNTDAALALLAIFILPFFIGWFFSKYKSIIKEKLNLSNTWYYAGFFLGWTITNILLSFVISILVDKDMWIIEQKSGGFLNGVEYPMFGGISFIILFGCIALDELYIYLNNKVNKADKVDDNDNKGKINATKLIFLLLRIFAYQLIVLLCANIFQLILQQSIDCTDNVFLNEEMAEYVGEDVISIPYIALIIFVIAGIKYGKMALKIKFDKKIKKLGYLAGVGILGVIISSIIAAIFEENSFLCRVGPDYVIFVEFMMIFIMLGFVISYAVGKIVEVVKRTKEKEE